MKEIHPKNQPSSLPLFQTLTAWLFLDRLHAPGWVLGVCGTLFGVYWLGCIIGIVKAKYVDIFGEEDHEDHAETIRRIQRKIRGKECQ